MRIEVPQGSILGPPLFCILIDDIVDVVRHCSLHLYADDVQLVIDAVNQSIMILNEDLSEINASAVSYGLLINPTKSQALMISCFL